MKRKKSREVKGSFGAALVPAADKVALVPGFEGHCRHRSGMQEQPYCSSSTTNPFSERAMEKIGNRMNKYRKYLK